MGIISRTLSYIGSIVSYICMALKYPNFNPIQGIITFFFTFYVGYYIHKLDRWNWPEDESNPYIQIHFGRIVFISLSTCFIISGVVFFVFKEYSLVAFILFMYINTLSGYFSEKFNNDE